MTLLLLQMILLVFSASLPSLWHFLWSCAYIPFPVDVNISNISLIIMPERFPNSQPKGFPISLFPGVFAPSRHGLFHQKFKPCSKQVHLLPSKLGPSVSTSVRIPEFSLLINLIHPNHLTSSHLL